MHQSVAVSSSSSITGNDEPQILRYAINSIWPIGADTNKVVAAEIAALDRHGADVARRIEALESTSTPTFALQELKAEARTLRELRAMLEEDAAAGTIRTGAGGRAITDRDRAIVAARGRELGEGKWAAAALADAAGDRCEARLLRRDALRARMIAEYEHGWRQSLAGYGLATCPERRPTMTTEDRRRPARLVDIRLSELSLVDRPANPHARVTLFKRADDKEHEMEIQKIAAYSSFDDAVAAIAKAEGLSHDRAMSRAAAAYPDLVEKYNAAGDEAVAKIAEAVRPAPVSKAVMAFEDRVDEIAKSRGIPRHAAMTDARVRFPDEFAAVYGE